MVPSSKIPDEILHSLHDNFGSIRSFTPASGGCINNGGRITTSTGDLFLKWNDAKKYPGMFQSEAKGLELLATHQCVRVPSVVMHHSAATYQFIVMEFITPGRPEKNYWEKLGLNLANLHHITSDNFGLDHNNYIGSLDQRNSQIKDWPSFFVQQRLQPQLEVLKPDKHLARKFDALFNKVVDIFPPEPPALIHGDLWSGNLLRDERGLPCLIDPAVYFAHREMELAFTQLFGGFDPRFYDTYKEVFPPEPGHLERADVCNLYPLLVHANLFGGHYLREIEDILRRWA
jgi:protein-ribulosamine 3-kinase